MFKNYLFLVIGLLYYSAGYGQIDTCTGILSGKILDEHDKSPLGYAAVYIEELERGTVADDHGLYRITGLCKGNYTIKISHIGCEPVVKTVQINGQTYQNFYPEHHISRLRSLEVRAKKIDEQNIQPRDYLSQEEISQSRGLPLGEALKSITGVNSINTGNSISKPVIHGMHSNRVLILNNGIRQEGQQWGVEHAPEIDPFTAGNLSVIKGANSVRYGSDAIAGVVIVEPKALRDSAGINGALNLVGASNGRSGTASAFIEGNFGKLKPFSWRIQGTLKQSGNVSAPNYILVNTGLKEYNFSYTLGWTKPRYGFEIYYSQFNTTLGIFGASHIGNLTDLKYAFSSPVPIETGPFTYKIGRPYQHIEHELFKAKTYLRTGENGKLSLTYARQYDLRYEYDKHKPLNDSLASLNKPELQFELTSHTADLVWEHHLNRHLSGSWGVSGITQGNTYEGRNLIPNFRNYSGGIFAVERFKSKRFEFEGGIRYDYKWLQIYRYKYAGNGDYVLDTPLHTFENISGNMGAVYKKDSLLNFSVNLGTAWRAPAVNELYSFGLHHGAAAVEYGDDSLKSERTYNIIFSINYLKTSKWQIEVSPYVHYINNFIYRKPAAEPILTIHGAFPAFYFTQTDALLSGCDFQVNYSFNSAFEFSGKSSLLNARDLTQNNWLILMPANRAEGEFTYRIKSKRIIKSAYFSVSALYVAKQFRVPANSDFAPPPDAYLLLNANAACTFKIQQQNIELGFSINNLANTTYRDYLDRFRYFTDAMGRNFSIRLTIPFNADFKKH